MMADYIIPMCHFLEINFKLDLFVSKKQVKRHNLKIKIINLILLNKS